MITALGPYCPGAGPTPCDLMIVGECPGYDEVHWFVNGVLTPTPFVGPTGQEQDRILMHNGLHRRRIYITNLVKRYIDGNTDPTADDIRAFEADLIKEILVVNPRYILSAGAFATRWFLGRVDMDATFGLPQQSNRPSCRGICIIPVYHPAYGLHDPEQKAVVWKGYERAAQIIRGEIPATPVEDEYPNPLYFDGGTVTYSDSWDGSFALDTEGPIEKHLRDRWWGFSISTVPGSATVFRRDHPDFEKGVGLVNELLAADSLPVFHSALSLDLDLLRRMGVVFPPNFRLYDTMVAQFFQRIEPQSLKTAARRWCGMEMTTYNEVIGDAAKERQVAYLLSILDHSWPKPEARVVDENDGTSRFYRPQPIPQRVERIITDWAEAEGDRTGFEAEGEEGITDLRKRWMQLLPEYRRQIEEKLGPWPYATLDDVPLGTAIRYSGRDPDATLRLRRKQLPVIRAMNLEERLDLDLDILPIIEEMQDTGFIGSRKYFEGLSSRMWDEMMKIGSHISDKYNEGRPFNPASAPQVAALAARRGLRGLKRTKSKKSISTSKKSMEHLRQIDPAMDAIFNWRERQKVKDSFADPAVELIPDGEDLWPITCTLKNTRVSSDRLAATDPPLLAIPIAKDIGRQVRGGYQAPDGCLLGAADLSQIEMRVMAHLSGDETLKQLFTERRDIHSETSISIFHLDFICNWSDDRDEYVYPSVDRMKHRNPTKRAGFGVITGIQGEGLLDQLRMMGCKGWRVEKFKDGQSDCVSEWCPGGIIHEWFRCYPRVKGYLRKCGDSCESHGGEIREMGGFPRYLHGVFSREEYTRAEARRQSHSHIIQGSAQWMIRRAMRWLRPRINQLRENSGLYLRWVLQIHDELILAFDERLADEVRRLVLEGLTEHSYTLSVPVEANWAQGKRWIDLEK